MTFCLEILEKKKLDCTEQNQSSIKNTTSTRTDIGVQFNYIIPSIGKII